MKVDEVVVATSTDALDDVTAMVSRRLGHRVVRGSRDDVLSRYVKAASETEADVIVRLTSDCPLLDHEISDAVISAFESGQREPSPPAYASCTSTPRHLPRGLDTEVMTRAALERAHRDASDLSEREHVTLHIYRRPETFRCIQVLPLGEVNLAHYRWTLDTIEDYHFLALVYQELGPDARLQDVLDLLRRKPELSTINAHIEQKKA
jgi:spore coat polysaccharide biosynthesis protein SpsF